MNTRNLEKEFVSLISQHQGIIHKVCHIYCSHSEDRKDTAQEIMMQLWRAYPSFRGESKISTWVYRVALNTAISNFRKIKARPLIKTLAELREIPSEDDGGLDEETTLLYKAISRLSKIEKAIILLYLDEKSYAEIAEIIGISKSNVSVKLVRIKSRLGNTLKPLFDP